MMVVFFFFFFKSLNPASSLLPWQGKYDCGDDVQGVEGRTDYVYISTVGTGAKPGLAIYPI